MEEAEAATEEAVREGLGRHALAELVGGQARWEELASAEVARWLELDSRAGCARWTETR